MSEMVERAAKAGFMAWAYGRIVDEADERFKEDWPVVKPMWLRAQTAAIEAMREPTEAMIEASNREWDGRMSHRSSGAWQAMITAALSPSREDEGK